VPENLRAIKAQHPQAQPSQDSVALRISQCSLRGEVLGSIDLDDELGARSIEVHYKAHNWPLAIKLDALNLFPPHSRPEKLLAFGHVLAEAPRHLL